MLMNCPHLTSPATPNERFEDSSTSSTNSYQIDMFDHIMSNWYIVDLNQCKPSFRHLDNFSSWIEKALGKPGEGRVVVDPDVWIGQSKLAYAIRSKSDKTKVKKLFQVELKDPCQWNE